MINKEKISILILVCNEIKTIEKDIISIKKKFKKFYRLSIGCYSGWKY